MKDLRLAAVGYDYYPCVPRILRMAEAAADAGHEMHVICLRDRGEKGHEVHNGVIVHRLPLSRSFEGTILHTLLGWAKFLLGAGMTLTWQQLRRPYQVIIVHNMPDFLVLAALPSRLLGAKVVLDVEDISPELMAAKSGPRLRDLLFRVAALQERISISLVDRVVTTGWLFHGRLQARGVPSQKIQVVLNSADPRLFPSSRRCPPPSWSPGYDGPFTITYYGTIAERNGLDTAVRALALALPRAPRLRLDIMGHGEHLPRVKALVEEFGIGKHVTFKSPCRIEEIVDFVLHGDAGIIPYHRDGFAELVLPTKAYELAWMQRPIIAADTPAIRSMFRPGSALLCDPANPKSFADALVQLYEHPELQRQMVDEATSDYAPFRWERERAKYQAYVASLCERPAKPATKAG